MRAEPLEIGPESILFNGAGRPEHERWFRRVKAGVWEPEVTSYLCRILVAGDVFFDVGAYLGAYTLLASRLVGDTGRVYAFEPDPDVRELLVSNVELNSARNVTVVGSAVGGDSKPVSFIAKGNSRSHVAVEGSLVISQTTLDDFSESVGRVPSIIKIDIEGGEWSALQASRVVRQAREVIVEVHEDVLRAQAVDIQTVLQSIGPTHVLGWKDSDNYWTVTRPTGVADTAWT